MLYVLRSFASLYTNFHIPLVSFVIHVYDSTLQQLLCASRNGFFINQSKTYNFFQYHDMIRKTYARYIKMPENCVLVIFGKITYNKKPSNEITRYIKYKLLRRIALFSYNTKFMCFTSLSYDLVDENYTGVSNTLIRGKYYARDRRVVKARKLRLE